MKILNKLLVLIILILLLIVIDKLTGVFGAFESHDTLKIERTSMDFGRDVFGSKISIRDNIRIKQKGEYKIDGKYLGLGNERKSVEISFLAELGYFIEDITKSQKVDSIKGDNILSRTIIVELPIPDTLSFIEMKQEEASNEWFWEGWYKGEENVRKRKLFLDELKQNAYIRFVEENMNPDESSYLKDASMTLLNYVNNGYKVGNEVGFDFIIATFKNNDGSIIVITCHASGNCTQETIFNNSLLN